MRIGERFGRRRAGLLVLVVALVAATAGVLATTGTFRAGDGTGSAPSPTASATPTPPPAPPVLAEASGTAAGGTGLRPGVAAALADPALGPDTGVLVLGDRGTVVLARAARVPRTPASLAKLVTGASVLLAVDPGTRLVTRVVAGSAPGEVVLVGAGDATLTRTHVSGDRLRPAGLDQLADATAAALPPRGAGAPPVRVSVDDSLFTGPAESPDWRGTYVPSGVVAPVHALSVDQGRPADGGVAREADPALAAGRAFAGLLAEAGVEVSTGPVRRTRAAADAERLAAVRSPEVEELVAHMLTTSDNDLAEALARVAAERSGQPGSFAGFRAAAAAALARLDVPAPGLAMLDGSGLARGSRIAPVTLARLLHRAATDDRLRVLLTGLPVAAFSGSLADRFGGPAAGGAGTVRAKTGTLTGVSGLAGLAVGADGRALVFAAMGDRVRDTLGARAALDAFAARLAANPSASG